MSFGIASLKPFRVYFFGGTFPQKAMQFYGKKLSHSFANRLIPFRYSIPVVSTIHIDQRAAHLSRAFHSLC
jgi:hypothetical protein